MTSALYHACVTRKGDTSFGYVISLKHLDDRSGCVTKGEYAKGPAGSVLAHTGKRTLSVDNRGSTIEETIVFREFKGSKHLQREFASPKCHLCFGTTNTSSDPIIFCDAFDCPRCMHKGCLPAIKRAGMDDKKHWFCSSECMRKTPSLDSNEDSG